MTEPGTCLCDFYALRIQDLRLPLHYAVEKGATKEVVEMLLVPESNASAADKARLPLCHCHTARTSCA